MTGPLKKTSLKDTAAFGREWLRSPRKVGAVVPSSARLARAISAGLSAQSGPVIELGPGTGIITSALLDRKIAPQNLATIELSANFAAALSKKHPDVQVIHGDATQIESLSPFPRGEVGQVVSGLPLLALPGELVEAILIGSFKVLGPQGAFRLFTYGPRCPVRPRVLARLGLKARRISITFRNLPPAAVYEITRIG